MAHQLEINRQTGKAKMFHRGSQPWHGLSTELPDNYLYDIDQAIVFGGLDWEVELRSVYLDDGRIMDKYCKAVVRKSDNKILSSCGPNWRPLQNRNAFNWFKPFLDAKLATLHTAGSLEGGRRVWVLAKIGETAQLSQSVNIEKYILLSNAHMQGYSIRAGFTPVNVVCANTLRMAHDSDASAMIRVRHTADAEDNLNNIRDVMNLTNQQFEATFKQYQLLINKHVSQTDVVKYVKQVFKVNEEDQISTRMENMMKRVLQLIYQGKGNTEPDVKNTLWSCYMGVTEYLTWEKGRNADTRLTSNWFGENDRMNQRALEICFDMAG